MSQYRGGMDVRYVNASDLRGSAMGSVGLHMLRPLWQGLPTSHLAPLLQFDTTYPTARSTNLPPYLPSSNGDLIGGASRTHRITVLTALSCLL
jgi:hypothetical protein